MKRAIVFSAAIPVLAMLLGGCSAPVEPGKGGDPQNTADPLVYPVGPYGYQSGDVIPNLEFLGRVDDNGDGSILDNPVRKIRLSDIYKDKTIKVLALMVAAEWCGPCQAEQPELISSWQQFQADKKGVYYLEGLIESAKKGSTGAFLPADLDTMQRWAGHNWKAQGATTGSEIPFPMMLDSTVELGPWYISPAFPMQLLIKTEDMTIQWQNNGYIPGALESNIKGILGE